jgi:3-oxoacyl-[acyl-carrier protein] reductase
LRPTRVCPLSIEVARFGINVNTITPGYIDTQRLEKVFSTGEKPAQQMRSDLEHEVPLGRIGTVEDIASLVALLVSPRGSYITGAVIPVDGGLLRAVR